MNTYRVDLIQTHTVFVEAEDQYEAVKTVRGMNDVEIAKAETCRGDMEIKNVESV